MIRADRYTPAPANDPIARFRLPFINLQRNERNAASTAPVNPPTVPAPAVLGSTHLYEQRHIEDMQQRPHDENLAELPSMEENEGRAPGESPVDSAAVAGAYHDPIPLKGNETTRPRRVHFSV